MLCAHHTYKYRVVYLCLCVCIFYLYTKFVGLKGVFIKLVVRTPNKKVSNRWVGLVKMECSSPEIVYNIAYSFNRGKNVSILRLYILRRGLSRQQSTQFQWTLIQNMSSFLPKSHLLVFSNRLRRGHVFLNSSTSLFLCSSTYVWIRTVLSMVAVKQHVCWCHPQ